MAIVSAMGPPTNLSLRDQPFWRILTPPYWPFINRGTQWTRRAWKGRQQSYSGSWQLDRRSLVYWLTPSEHYAAIGSPCIWLHGWIALVGPVLPMLVARQQHHSLNVSASRWYTSRCAKLQLLWDLNHTKFRSVDTRTTIIRR